MHASWHEVPGNMSAHRNPSPTPAELVSAAQKSTAPRTCAASWPSRQAMSSTLLRNEAVAALRATHTSSEATSAGCWLAAPCCSRSAWSLVLLAALLRSRTSV